jgi:hypothetical protein
MARQKRTAVARARPSKREDECEALHVPEASRVEGDVDATTLLDDRGSMILHRTLIECIKLGDTDHATLAANRFRSGRELAQRTTRQVHVGALASKQAGHCTADGATAVGPRA